MQISDFCGFAGRNPGILLKSMVFIEICSLFLELETADFDENHEIHGFGLKLVKLTIGFQSRVRIQERNISLFPENSQNP